MAETDSQYPDRLLSWLPFSIAAAAMILSYLVGSRFESYCFVILFAASWLTNICLLLLFPRNRFPAVTITVIGCLAVLCRIILLIHIPANISMQTMPVRLISILFDLGTLGFLMALLYNRCLALRWSILYAFNPVILYSFSGQGHPDSAILFFLMGALFFYDRRKWRLMFLCAGLSVPFGWVSAAAVPFFLRRENWKYLWAFLLAASMALYPEGYPGWGLFHFIDPEIKPHVWFAGPIRTLVQSIIENVAIADTAVIVLLCIVLLFGYRSFHPRINPQHKDDPVSGCFFAMGACLLFSKTVSFWHLSWILPFLSMRPSASWMVLSLTMGAYFLKSGATVDGFGFAWVKPLVWIPFWVFFIHDIYLWLHRKKAPVDTSSPETVSVVIPVINEVDRIGPCITAAKGHPAVREIIVVDGGSRDLTAQKAERAGAITIQLQPDCQKRGRGGQIYEGIRWATQDLVAIVHADTKIDALMVEKMILLMKKQPMIAGGAVGSVFDDRGLRFRILELANDFRMVCMGVSFGDQVQFFRRTPVMETGLYPDIPLMEDVEFGIRLHRLGRQAYLFGDAGVSPRRWEQKGLGHVLTVLRLFCTYMFQRLWKTPDTRAMYRVYYGNPENSG
jgi:hypothetical protein